ncbi:cation:proton antiporter [Prevotella sp. E15-22]|uniref:cation:proton antiporter n=1 Tax=Prevotella sp. E15-22 TaxID=2937774 RepID=UPI0020607C90|nr:cation:proton antiporter [Prevotella sp. E15-22]UPS43848.1 cation:proton antiporter [Prevotella sp. E15-22]
MEAQVVIEPLIKDPTLIFFVVLLIILLAPIVMSKLRIPHIIGMVLAGVLIGEHGLNLLQRDISFEVFGQVGLYYIMFLAGLEMDMESVKKNSKRLLIFGLLTCIVPLVLTYLMSISILGYSGQASFLLGCIMASNTLVAYPIIGRYGLQQNSSVMISVGSSMLSLFMALVMLAGLVGSFSPDSGFLFWVFFLFKIAVFCAGSILLIPRLARYFLRRYSDAVMQYIFVISVMFLSAALSAFIGLEGIFGAFFSGLILNRYIPHVSPLMNRTEFIGNAIFIPYFLIGVGMLINLNTLADGAEIWGIVLLIAFIGTFGKALAAYISALLFKLTKAEGHMMFGLTSAHAAGAIAMVMVGRRLLMDDGTALADDNMLNGVVIMILVTCIISTMMTEKASKEIVFSERAVPDMKKPQQDDEKIMVCVKYPEIAPQLLELAQLTRNQKLKRELVALNVVYDGENSAHEREQGMRLLEQLQRQASASEMQVQTQVRLATNIANGIKHAFRESGCSEIVMGMHVHTEVTKKFWGEFIQSLYNGLNRQILLMRFTQPLSTLRRIQVAVPSRAEFEPGFNRWLERLCRFACQLDCRIQFHGRHESLTLIEQYVNNQHPSVRAEYTYMAHWNELPQLASHIGTDNLLVVVTARKGTISYKAALDRLPDELTKYFSGTNLMIIFPDQYGNTKEEKMSFTEAQHHEENSIYDTLMNWINKKRV